MLKSQGLHCENMQSNAWNLRCHEPSLGVCNVVSSLAERAEGRGGEREREREREAQAGPPHLAGSSGGRRGGGGDLLRNAVGRTDGRADRVRQTRDISDWVSQTDGDARECIIIKLVN